MYIASNIARNQMKCFPEYHNTEIRKTFETLFDEIFISKVCDQGNKSQWNPTVFLEHYFELFE